MNMEFTESQRLLKETVERALADVYKDFQRRSAYRAEPMGWSTQLWHLYAKLGLLGVPFSESDAGYGGTSIDAMIVMEAVGRWLVVEPYLATVILSGTLLTAGGSQAQRQQHIHTIINGSRRFAFAHSERQARYDLHDVAASAVRSDDGFVLSGQKCQVLHGDSADFLIVSARTRGGRRDRDGISLFLVSSSQSGVSIEGYDTHDGLRAADITFAAVRIPNDALIGERNESLSLIELAVDTGIAALAAEATGAMDALFSMTVEYLKTRKQFGVHIGSFQAVQHRAVDMLLALEQARSMALYAATMVAEPVATRRRAAMSAVKVQINDSARIIGQSAMQLHGGIAMTDKYRAGHYFKRLTAVESLFGDTAHHLTAMAAAGAALDAG